MSQPFSYCTAPGDSQSLHHWRRASFILFVSVSSGQWRSLGPKTFRSVVNFRLLLSQARGLDSSTLVWEST